MRYKIPTPLKGVVEDISKCIYSSEFCRYNSVDIAATIVAAAIQNKSIDAISMSPNPDTVFWRIYKGVDLSISDAENSDILMNSFMPAITSSNLTVKIS